MRESRKLSFRLPLDLHMAMLEIARENPDEYRNISDVYREACEYFLHKCNHPKNYIELNTDNLPPKTVETINALIENGYEKDLQSLTVTAVREYLQSQQLQKILWYIYGQDIKDLSKAGLSATRRNISPIPQILLEGSKKDLNQKLDEDDKK